MAITMPGLDETGLGDEAAKEQGVLPPFGHIPEALASASEPLGRPTR